jgi:alpha-glucosidase (family GH31 glycosyl hydrolase)
VRHGGVREYDVHNLFGTAMAHDHFKAVKAITGKRPFLLSRYARGGGQAAAGGAAAPTGPGGLVQTP